MANTCIYVYVRVEIDK